MFIASVIHTITWPADVCCGAYLQCHRAGSNFSNFFVGYVPLHFPTLMGPMTPTLEAKASLKSLLVSYFGLGFGGAWVCAVWSFGWSLPHLCGTPWVGFELIPLQDFPPK